MIKYLRLPFQFDAPLLQQEVLQLDAGAWKMHHQKLHYDGGWTVLSLRSLDGSSNNIFTAVTDSAEHFDTPLLDHCPYMRSVLDQFHCPLNTVRLMKLNAGAIIKEHRDIELNYENGSVRFHIPVITHQDVEFYLDHERLQLREGECWYLNFNLPHSIINNSPVDRIHLVIDANVNDWVKNIFSDGSISNRKEFDDPGVNNDPTTKKEMIFLFRQMNTETSKRLADELEKELEN